MADIEVMDREKVRAAADGLDGLAGSFRAVNTALEALLVILRTTAFIGMVGGAAVERYIANLKPHIESLAKLFEKHANILRQAEKTYAENVEGRNTERLQQGGTP